MAELDKVNFPALATMVLLGLSLLTALLLELNMSTNADLQLLLLFIGLVVVSGIFYKFWNDAEDTYRISLFVFIVALLNLIWLVIATGQYLLAVFALLVNMAGLVICIVKMQDSYSILARPTVVHDMSSLETYDLAPLRQVAKRKKKKRR